MNNKYLIAILAVIVLAGGYWFLIKDRDQQAGGIEVKQNLNEVENDGQAVSPIESTKNEGVTGKITGSLSYPSHGIPEIMQVCAENLSTKKVYCTDKQISGQQYQYGKGYEIVVPTGSYHVYQYIPANDQYLSGKAYYTEFVTCGQTVGCDDHTKIVVQVKANQTVSNINPWDW